MHPTMRSVLPRAIAAAALATTLAVAGPLGAQAFENTGLIVAPHFTQYTIGSSGSERTITQMAVPFVVLMPLSERFSFDITTAFANSEVKAGAVKSTISGLTDTQLRANYSLNDMMVFTLGLNLPTGQYTVDEADSEAAEQIGNDFLNYPISSMGNGLAGTGGFAMARPMGSWNVGLGASMRKSTEFAAYALSDAEFRFTPADEYRIRLGVDRPIGDGEIAFGVAFSAYGEDAADTTDGTGTRTTVSTGDRLTVNGSWMRPLGRGELYLSAWDLYRMAGQKFGGDAPAENVANINAAYSMEVGQILVQPSLEGRFWQVDGARAGQLTNLNVRLRLGTGMISFFPSVGYSIGSLYSLGTGDAIDVNGFRGSLTIRIN
jgi:hypothetical protein